MNNVWGAIGIYASTFVNRASNNVSIDGNVYSQDNAGAGLFNTNVEIEDWDFIVTNPNFPEFVAYAETREDAELIAGGTAGSVIENLNPRSEPLPLMNNARKVSLMLMVLGLIVVLSYKRVL